MSTSELRTLPYQSRFVVEGRTIGAGYPTYFIADLAANHDGSLSRAKDLIYLAKEAGADAAKFQHFSAETIVSDRGFRELGGRLSHQAGWKSSVYDVYKAASLPPEWTAELSRTCHEAGITFFTAPYAQDLVELVDPFVPAYKIGSGDVTWVDHCKHIASKKKPVFLATGAATIDDVLRATSAITSINAELCLMQCNTNYTGSLENFNCIHLNVLKLFSTIFPGMPLGLSDHTPGHTTVLGAVALGACAIEKHFTDDTSREGPDHAFSMDPRSWKVMVERTRELEAALGTSIKAISANENETVILQRRAIRMKRKMQAGEYIQEADVVFLRPCPENAFAPYELQSIAGRRLKLAIEAGEHITHRHLE